MKVIFMLVICCLFSGCHPAFLENRFAKNDSIGYLYFGKYSIYSDFDKECKKRDMAPDGNSQQYKNGVSPSRICVHANRQQCRINITCKNLDGTSDESCVNDAHDYWRTSKKTREVCELEKKKCNSAPKGDRSCLK